MLFKKKEAITCENCGRSLAKGETYEREIHGPVHTFCSAECADAFEMKTTGHLHHY